MSVNVSLNINAIALLRNRRNLPWPDIQKFVRLGLEAGAHGITIHPRPDQRHIRYSDVFDISCFLRDEFTQCELNVEGFPTPFFLAMIQKIVPNQVTLVPDSPEQATSDHGWDFLSQYKKLIPIVKGLKTLGVRVSLFSDPDIKGIQAAADTGADRIEIYTGIYAACYMDAEKEKRELDKIYETALLAHNLGLGVNAGHDITVSNLFLLCNTIPFLSEISIGHALISDALEFGFSKAVERFLDVSRLIP